MSGIKDRIPCLTINAHEDREERRICVDKRGENIYLFVEDDSFIDECVIQLTDKQATDLALALIRRTR